MCSVSWWWSKDSAGKNKLSVLFNRDEKKSRALAKAPHSSLKDNLTVIHPTDTQRGGTWIASNSAGIGIALLNNYEIPTMPGKPYSSRGEIVKKVADCITLETAQATLKWHLTENPTPPFSLLIWDAESKITQLHCWDEHELSSSVPESNFLTSSSWKTAEVQSYRHEMFRTKVLSGEMTARDFHFHEVKGFAEWSAMMQREKTQTVSITQVLIDSSKISMIYFDRSNGHVSELEIPRQHHA